MMALDLCMIGLITGDMSKSLEFYRRLGLAIPENNEGQTHVEVKMSNGLTFFLDSAPYRFDPSFAKTPEVHQRAPSNHYPFLLEFYLKERSAVEAKYIELTGLGYQSHQPPYVTPLICILHGSMILMETLFSYLPTKRTHDHKLTELHSRAI